MTTATIFPTSLHRQIAELTSDLFSTASNVDTVLLVNSCARGQAIPESDIDFAILVKSGTTAIEIEDLEKRWHRYAFTEPTFLKYKQSHSFAQIHLDIIDGKFSPTLWDDGGRPDFFEIEIGNRLAYSLPISNTGYYFQQLQKQWLPYYEEGLRLQRFTMVRHACMYDLNHVPFFIKRGLYFQAFDRLYKAFQEFLQVLFIAHKTYPIAYNKWIKEQVENYLQLSTLYPKLPTILSINNIESGEMNEKAKIILELLQEIDIS